MAEGALVMTCMPFDFTHLEEERECVRAGEIY